MPNLNNSTYSNVPGSEAKGNSRNSTKDCSVDNCSVDNKTTSREEIPAPRRTSETDVFPERERRDGPGGE